MESVLMNNNECSDIWPILTMDLQISHKLLM